ncbi:Nn.00g054950.m01.CDS01 [Neocucurbitaria sp. VM-36]
MIYMLNTFGFNGHKALDHWTTKRAIGQRRLITRVDIPYDYMGLYRGGFRKKLREKFPDIERIGVDIMVPYFGQRLEENSLEKAKQRVINFVEKKEGEDIKVDWYSSSMGSPL